MKRERLLANTYQAVEWAIEEEVDIISMSFGLDSQDTEIDDAIDAACAKNISIFAAASNSGGNRDRAYPANRIGVICIHASDGYGNDGGISPTPLEEGRNFSTLGIRIFSKWKKTKTCVSGTSYATPIAAAIFANILEFARHKCSLSERDQNKLRRSQEASQVLYRLGVGRDTKVKGRGGYDYIMPNLLRNGKSEQSIIELIQKCAKGLIQGV